MEFQGVSEGFRSAPGVFMRVSVTELELPKSSETLSKLPETPLKRL